MISQHLKDFKFCKIAPRDKRPFERGWGQKGYSITEIEQYIVSGNDGVNNYGVITGDGLIVIDIDHADYCHLLGCLPSTFSVRTSKGYHCYFKCTDIPKKITMYDKTRTEDTINKSTGEITQAPLHIGEIQSKGEQVVGHGSIHPSGVIYTIHNDIPVAEITRAGIACIFGKYMGDPPSETLTNGLNVFDVLEKHNVVLPRGKDQILIEHPLHGATNGGNLSVNRTENNWFCHRCETGGGVVQLVAMMNGLVSCDEISRSTKKHNGTTILSPEVFKKSMEIIERDYGKHYAEQIKPYKTDKDAGSPLKLVTPHLLQHNLTQALTSKIYPTGFSFLDEHIGGGFREGKTYLLAGRSGGGKTRVSVGLLHNLTDVNILYVSTEMDPEEIMALAIAQDMGQSCNDIADGKIPGATDVFTKRYPKLLITTKEKEDGKNATISVKDIRATVDQCIATGMKPSIVVVDYITHLDDPSFVDKSTIRLMYGEMAENLNRIAEEYNVAMVILAQTSRADNGKQDFDDTMLAESDNILRAVDTCMGLGRDSNNPQAILVYVGKNRRGKSGKVILGMDWMYNKLTSPEVVHKSDATTKEVC